MNFHYELGSSIPHSSSKCSQNTKKQKQTDEERQQPATGIRVNRKVSHKCSWHQLHSCRDGRSAGEHWDIWFPQISSKQRQGHVFSSMPRSRQMTYAAATKGRSWWVGRCPQTCDCKNRLPLLITAESSRSVPRNTVCSAERHFYCCL